MSKKGKKPSEVFISHSNQDRAVVTRLGVLLRKNKVPFWYSPPLAVLFRARVGLPFASLLSPVITSVGLTSLTSRQVASGAYHC